jgi:hypothetical protein
MAALLGNLIGDKNDQGTATWKKERNGRRRHFGAVKFKG